MSLKSMLIKNTLWLLSADVIDKALSYIIIVVLARTLGAVGLGEYSFAFAFAGLIFMIADLGVGSYLLRESSRSIKRAQKIFSTALTIKIFLITIAFILTMSIVVHLGKPAHVIASVLILCIIMSLQQVGGNLFEATFISRNKMSYIAITRAIEKVATLGLGVYLLMKFKSLFLFFIALLIAYILRFLYNIFFIRRFLKIRFAFDKKTAIKILKGGIPLWLTALFALIYFRIDIIMISLMVGDEAVGWYSAAYKLIDALNFIPYLIFIVTFPSMSLLFEKNKKLLAELLNRVLRYMTYLAIPMAVGTIMLADKLLQLIYGQEFQNSVLALQILILAEAVVFITLLMGNAMNAINKEREFTYLLIFLSAFNIILNLFLIPIYSYIGAAIATAITELISLVSLTILLKKNSIKIRFELFKPLLSAIMMGVSIWFLKFLAIWWLIPIGMIVYFTALFSLGLKKDDKSLIKDFIAKILPADH